MSSVWLVPLMDLLVQLKLHIVGRWVVTIGLCGVFR
jgi:hypothetical protein